MQIEKTMDITARLKCRIKIMLFVNKSIACFSAANIFKLMSFHKIRLARNSISYRLFI